MLFCLYFLTIFVFHTHGKSNKDTLLQRLSHSDPAHQLLWRNYNNYYYIDYDDGENELNEAYDMDEYYYYDEEEMGLFQAWFDFKMGYAEKILLTYLVGAKANVQLDFDEQWKKFEESIGKFKRSNWITDKLTPEAWVTKFKKWAKEKTSWGVDRLTTAFQQVVIIGYNKAKESMAKEKKLKFRPFAPTADQLMKLPESETSRHWITKWIRQKAFNLAVKLINKLFKSVIESTQKELEQQAEEFIDNNIVKNAPFWKGWLKAHLNRMFQQILESLKSQGFGLFNHAKRAIATGADLKYNELLDIKNKVPKAAPIQAKIEYFNQLIETAAVKEYDDLLDY